MSRVVLLVLAWLVMWITPAAGYEFETHDRLSRAAFQSSGVVAHLESAYGITATTSFLAGCRSFAPTDSRRKSG